LNLGASYKDICTKLNLSLRISLAKIATCRLTFTDFP